jgi:hypothetical protein
MMLTIAASDSAGVVDNWSSGRADHWLSFWAESAARFMSILGIWVQIRSRADGHDGDGDVDGDVDGDGDGDGTESA